MLENKNKYKICKRYQDTKELYKKKKYKQALLECQDCFILNGWDTRFALLYVKVLKKLNQEQQAADFIMENITKFDQEYLEAIKKELLTSLCVLERYEEALEVVNDLMQKNNRITNEERKIYNKYNRIKMSILKVIDPMEFDKQYANKKSHLYVEEQFIKYDESVAIKKIKTKKQRMEKKANATWNFDIEEKIKEVKEKLDPTKKEVRTIFDYYYIYDYACGVYDGKTCNYIKVATIKNTNNIMKLEPILYDRIIKKEETQIVNTEYKKKDMIKRFYDRYNKK